MPYFLHVPFEAIKKAYIFKLPQNLISYVINYHSVTRWLCYFDQRR